VLNLPRCADIPLALLTRLNAVAPISRGKEWERQTNDVKEFKEAVMDQGLAIQENRCVWCGLLTGLDGHQGADRDHIAPKKHYPQWTFEPLNIAISCEYCNRFNVKADLDTVSMVAGTYSTSDFLIVHPYLEDPADHLTFGFQNNGRGVTVKGITAKGIWTVINMKLDSPSLTKLRAQEVLFLQTYESLPPHLRELALDASAGL
jgi:uncharacterized protein (TIGR02646 family)